MQLLITWAILYYGEAFSILGRIGGDATITGPLSSSRRNGLSVSSVGSEAMQPLSVLISAKKWDTFSILGRIGGDATSSGPTAAARLRAPLSVSSVGSEAMQRMIRAVPNPVYPPFSILGRIGGDATGFGRSSSIPILGFQYPRSDRRRCNPMCETPVNPD